MEQIVMGLMEVLMKQLAFRAGMWLLGDDPGVESVEIEGAVEQEAVEHEAMEVVQTPHRLPMLSASAEQGSARVRSRFGTRSCSQGSAAADTGHDIRRAVARFLAGDESDSSEEASDVSECDGLLDLGHPSQLPSMLQRQSVFEPYCPSETPTFSLTTADRLHHLNESTQEEERQHQELHPFGIGRQAGTPQDLLEYMRRRGQTTVAVVDVPDALSTLHGDSLTELLGRLGFRSSYDFALCVPVLVGSEEIHCAYVNLVSQEALAAFVAVWWGAMGTRVYAAPTLVRSSYSYRRHTLQRLSRPLRESPERSR
eukprot:TRINITY_DN12090_c0_g1_i1.p1 TRINITY_DN12090_c0_g1~~TRINITY_DN12090_c0_g1_i1.p1  ORF type:complete len:312 (+),score=26.33 TRINITY_DN12090_c0_g1_i1:172-1107(+)